MQTVETGFGSEMSVESAALLVAVGSSVLFLAYLLAVGNGVVESLLEVSITGVVMGLAYYAGLRFRS
ncbi:hypothetical protein GL213_04195 [Halogeometricum borinquense]|uniref:Uncharacterized protein n=1 Tax=Halogeometricum borinquense TaxID=60847 RepID=A0A6C0UID2_9EURY|nr:hypothetical protein [Halogeometricum borinquense]QIB75262.1 hypothetical protein G3I44_13785 [Halogeometricum borinquense]QIQ75793.1 hypothetical protein GL213_04195 [Halogeometricum borinquense]